MAFVYWIHLPEHSDVTLEGYVGITKESVKKRLREHKHYSKTGSYPISKAFRKYGDKLICTTLLEGDYEYCKLIENKLRPSEKIGWNIVKGGQDSPMLGRKHSKETVEKLRKASFSRSKEVVDSCKKNLIYGIKGQKPWLVPAAKKSTWIVADKLYEYYLQNPKHGTLRFSRHFNLENKYSAFNIIQNFRKGWNPNLDQDWLEWVSINKTFNKGN